MKTIPFYFIIVFSSLFMHQSFAQPGCPCLPVAYLTPDPADPCCYFLNLDFSNSPGCDTITGFDQVTVNTAAFGGTGTVTGATGSAPFSAILGSSTLVTFSTSPGFISSVPSTYVAGRVCFANASSAFFPALFTFSNSTAPGGGNCQSESFQDDLTTTCTSSAPCCEPDIILSSDALDPCCVLIDLDFLNLANCTNPTGFDSISVVTSGSAIITSVAPFGSFSATLNNPMLASYTSASIFPGPQQVGRICFANNFSAPFSFQLTVSNSTITPDPCAKSFTFFAETPCLVPCDSIMVKDTSVCSTDESLLIPLLGCNSVPPCSATQVKWYIQSPCVPGGGGPWTLLQVKNDCSPLLLIPNQYTSDICVYAEVIPDASCPCPLLVSNIATVELCAPISCSIQNSNPEFCDCGTPSALTVPTPGGTSTCPSTVAWYDSQGNLVGTSNSYTPPTLCFQGQPADCYQDYTYKAVVDGLCGKDSCFTSIRVYNINAPKGKLEVLPAQAEPYCSEDAAILKFTPGCAGDPKLWNWYVRPCSGGSATHLTNAGPMNPLYYTNKLDTSVYYYVETQNSVTCPLDTVQLKIEVKDTLSIISFNAVSDPCVEQFVNLTLDFKPCTITGCGTPGATCACTHTVCWYKDGNVIGSNTWSQSPATFSYLSPFPLAGNYYAVLKDDCCPNDSLKTELISFAPSCVPTIKGPCFRCNNELVTLTGCMVLPPRDTCPDICTYQWCEVIGGVPTPIIGATNLSYVTNHAGTFILKSDCNGCIKWSDPFVLPQCTNNCSCGSLQWATLFQNWGSNQFISCNNSANPAIAPCPKQGRDYVIHGHYFCGQSSCKTNTVNWELTRPAPLPPLVGIKVTTYPYFFITMPWAQCVQPGIYTLKITRQCGLVPCSCSFTFEVPNCGCLCSDLMADANKGFHIGGNGLNCLRSFKPYDLDDCDNVTWSVNNTVLPGSSTGNNAFNYNFGSNGTYTVCMNVTRQPITGPPCTTVKCRTINVNCFGDPYGFCEANTLKNGNFTEGLVPGPLNNSGEAEDWMLLPELADGQAFVDDSAGGYDDGYVVLYGGLNNEAALYQLVNLAQGSNIVIDYNRRNFSGEELPAGTKLEFRLYADTSLNAESQLLYTEEIQSIPDTGWVAKSNAISISTNPNYPYLVVLLTNDDPMETPSVIGLDNLEICNNSVCEADFTFDVNCGVVTFTDESVVSDTPSWLWTFTGGTPASSTSQNPVVTYPSCGVYQVCLTATGTGVGTSCSSTVCHDVVITDTTVPDALCASGVIVTLDANCSAVITPEMIDGGSSDNCEVQSMSVSPNMFTECGTALVTLTVTDWCGNSSSCSSTIQIIEEVVPVIVCPANLSLSCNSDLEPSTTGFATATDNCDPDPVISYTDVIAGQMPCDGLITRTWTATDDCGNVATCTQLMTVFDNVPPVLTNCSPDISVTGVVNLNGICNAMVSVPSPTFTDNCDPSLTLTNSFNNTADASGIYPSGNTVVTWTATDLCGNTAVCSFSVEVVCDSCCVDFDAFCLAVENAVSISVDNVICKASVTIGDLPDCDYLEYVDWGDGQQDTGPFNAGDMTMHIYAGSGTYVVSWLALELDADGQICFEKLLSDTITVICNSCCTDFDAFCLAVENAVTIIVENDSCKASVAIGDLPDCNYLEYVNWGDGQQDTGPFNAGDIPMHVYAGSGTYVISWLALELDANGQICFEKLLSDTVTVLCDSCCVDFDAFCVAVENAVTITVDNDTCKVSVNIGDLSDCDYLEYVDWGDGQQDAGPFNAGDMTMHIYAGSGTYVISWLAIELDEDGLICFEKLLSDTITVLCDSCCVDFDAFCLAVENAVTIIVENDSCKASVAIGDLPDCDYLEYVDWGDGQQDTGPFNAGDIAMHVYAGSGTYVISWLAIELNANGQICFEKLLSDTITVLCDSCCVDFDAFCLAVENAVTITVENDSCKASVAIGNLPGCDYLEYVDWGDGQQDAGPFNTGDMTMHVYAGSGTYVISWLAIELDTDGLICFEKLISDSITVLCDSCCTDFDAFCLAVENAVTITVENDSCKASVAIGNLPDCDYLEYVDWGDGQQDAGPFNAGDMTMHVYAGSGTYVISWLAIELDEDGLICFEKLISDSITVLCDSCCVDFDAFCLAVENAVTITVENDSCKASVAIGNLPDCDYLEYVDWGDGQQDAGPFNAGDMTMHVYAGSGTYVISWLAIELDEDGLICFEKVISDTITLVCMVGIESPDINYNIQLFPNPTSGEFTLYFDYPISKNGKVLIMDLWERKVQLETLQQGEKDYSLSLASVPAGIYFVKVMFNGVPIWVDKVVKQ